MSPRRIFGLALLYFHAHGIRQVISVNLLPFILNDCAHVSVLHLVDGAIYSSLTDGASRLLDLELDVSHVSVISELNESFSSRNCHTSVECVDEHILFSIEIHVNARIILCSLYILNIYSIFGLTWFLCR